MHAGAPRVGVVVVNYNTAGALRECLRSLAAVDYPDFFTVVVDNASTDGSADMVGREFPGDVIVPEKKNHGFAKGNNIGIRLALEKGAEYICLMNPDVVAGRGFLKPLVRALEKDDSVWLAAPKVMLPGAVKRVHSAGGYMSRLSCFGYHFGYGMCDRPAFNRPRECDFITACCWLLSRRALEKAGDFHEPFFLYFEDTDYCHRIRKAGGKILYQPESVVTHSPSTSTGGARHPRTVYYQARNHALFIKRCRSGVARLLTLVYFFAYNFARLAAWLFRGQGRLVHAAVLGAADFLRGKYGQAENAVGNPGLRPEFGKVSAGKKPRLLLANPIGHTGQAYPDEMLTDAIAARGWQVVYATCREYSRGEPAGVKVVQLYRGSAGNRLLTAAAYFISQVRLISLSFRSRPDIIHIENFRLAPLDILVLLALKLLGFRVAYMAHDVTSLDPGWVAQRITRALYSVIYRLVDSITVFAGNARRELAVDYLVPSEKVYRVAHGHFTSLHADAPDRDEARKLLDLPEERPVLLFFGTIKKAKGLDILLEALAEVKEGAPGVLLVIAGKMWRHGFSHYEKRIAALGLDDNVKVELGFVPYDRANALYAASDIVVLPYFHVYFSAVAMQAMSFERPLVASAVGVIIEIVNSGKNGLLVPPGDSTALAAALTKLIGDKRLRDSMGAEAKRAVEDKFGWERTARELISQYRWMRKGLPAPR